MQIFTIDNRAILCYIKKENVKNVDFERIYKMTSDEILFFFKESMIFANGHRFRTMNLPAVIIHETQLRINDYCKNKSESDIKALYNVFLIVLNNMQDSGDISRYYALDGESILIIPTNEDLYKSYRDKQHFKIEFPKVENIIA